MTVFVYLVEHTKVINLLMNADILWEWKHRLALIFFIQEILWQVLQSPNLENHEISKPHKPGSGLHFILTVNVGIGSSGPRTAFSML